jgi:siroheme synthase
VLRSPLGEIAALATHAQVAAPALLIVGEVAALASSGVAADPGAPPAPAQCAERALA